MLPNAIPADSTALSSTEYTLLFMFLPPAFLFSFAMPIRLLPSYSCRSQEKGTKNRPPLIPGITLLPNILASLPSPRRLPAYPILGLHSGILPVRLRYSSGDCCGFSPHSLSDIIIRCSNMNFHLSGFVQFHKKLFLCFCEIVIAVIILSFFYFVNSDKLFFCIERTLVNMFVFSV